MGVLIILTILVVYINARTKKNPNFGLTTEALEQELPVPEGFSLQKRNAYKVQKGEIKYRVVTKPSFTVDPLTKWNIYTSNEYGFTFTFPPSLEIKSTEALGFQLPPDKAFKGSRDSLEIAVTKPGVSADLLYMNYTDFQVGTSTALTAETSFTNNGFIYSKKIYSDPSAQAQSNEIIVYKTEYAKKSYIWYGVMSDKDFESINDFESIVRSFKFGGK